MPSSPELATVWQPQEFLATPRLVTTTVQEDGPTLFELSGIVAIPETLLAPARSAAEQTGYVAGWNRGHQEGRDHALRYAAVERKQAEAQSAACTAELGRATGALDAAARDLASRAADGSGDIEELIVTSAFRIAEALVGVALADDEVRGRAAVARALALVPAGEPVTVALNPADHRLLPDGDTTGQHVRFVADPALAPGDAEARTGATTFDARVSAGLARVRALLVGEGSCMTNMLERVNRAVDQAVAVSRPVRSGHVDEVRGLSIRVSGLPVRVGDLVSIHSSASKLPAEVVAVNRSGADQSATCLPLGIPTGMGSGDRVTATGGPLTVPIGTQLLGRVLDGLGRPMDGAALPASMPQVPVTASAPNAMTRDRVDTPMPLGVRVIDTMTPLGRGQRMGIFAGSGVGKSSLLSMITRGTDAQVTVLALIGERGREVREFLEDDLGADGLRNAVVVVATSDQPPMVRLRAAYVATRIAEWFRDTGQHVLLMMDSLTRLAMAQREVGLSAGEPPTTRGYPPSVFALLPQLLERAGASSSGSITGLYTVLVEGDDHNEPIADTARSILDGHVVLDRRLANAGHFPAIDVLQSVSRVAGAVTSPERRALSQQARRLIAARHDVKELVEIGAYVAGTNPDADVALRRWPAIEGFLRQDLHDLTPIDAAWAALADVTNGAPR